MNIDVKAFKQDVISQIVPGRLEQVMNTVRTGASLARVEITTLIIPHENDDLQEIRK
jgi:pyruvate formate lyase activating enzyme